MPSLSLAALLLLLTLGCTQEPAGRPEVTLKLGGKFCEMYPDAITSALMTVDGVKRVDLRSKKGHAVVTGDPAVMRTRDVAQALDAVKGEGWHCEAEIVR